MNYLTIGTPSIRKVATGTRLESEVIIGGVGSLVYFEVDSDFADHLCADRADAFLVALFLHAFLRGENVRVNAPVSESLVYQINFALAEFLASIYPGQIETGSRVDVEALLPPVESVGAVGTGVSCGIDSLATILRHRDHECPSYRLTHLCFFDTGSHRRPKSESSAALYAFRRQLARDFSKTIQLPLVEVRSNLSEIIPHHFGLTHTYLNSAAALALQPLFATYLYSSGASTRDFLAFTSDPAYFDSYLLPLLSTRSLRFYSGEENLGRFAKTSIVASHPLSRDFLNVCNVNGSNCGQCNKCIRTLLALDALGVIDQFNKVFDLKLYRESKNAHLIFHCTNFLKRNPAHLDLDAHITSIIGIRHRLAGRWQYSRNKIGTIIRTIRN